MYGFMKKVTKKQTKNKNIKNNTEKIKYDNINWIFTFYYYAMLFFYINT